MAGSSLLVAGAAAGRGLVLLLLSPLLAQGARHGVAPAGRHEVKLLAANEVQVAGQKGLHHGAIVPALDPKSDSHFFKKDYPDDMQPSPSLRHQKVFDHPYPVVQDHQDYDKDFVKDENSDNGEWQAQMEYDTLRTKLRGQQKVVDEAQHREQEERHDVEDAEQEEHDAREAEEKAKEDAAEAAAEAEEAEHEVEKLVGKRMAHAGEDGAGSVNGSANGSADVPIGGAIGDAIGDVKDRTKHLEHCQKKLADAKAALEKLLKDKEKHLKEAVEAKNLRESERAAAQKKVDQENAEAAAKFDAGIVSAEKNLGKVADEAQSAHEAMDKKVKELEKKVAEAEAAHAEAKKAHDEWEAQLHSTEAQLQEAAARVRQHRAGVDQDGGIHQPKKSSGSSPSLGASAVGLALLAAALAGCPQ